MSVPAQRESRQASAKWETIRSALSSNARTFRLCLILLAVNSPLIVLAVRLASRVPM
jgi:hypothetical protein